VLNNITSKGIISSHRFEYVFLFVIVLTGAYFRLKGLGKWPLAVDEYYLVKSAGNILNYGLPEFQSGGYYIRGLLLQYIIAGLMLIGIKAEFAARIIPALMNIITVVPLYLLAKKVSDKLVASAIVIIFCLSVWETEFARFARMYTPFQLIFVLYIYFLYKYFAENERKGIIWAFILSFICIFVFEGGIFIISLNFLILFWNPEKQCFGFQHLRINKRSFTYLFICVTILGLYYLYYNFNILNFIGSASQERYPEGFWEAHNQLYRSAFLRKPFLQILTIPDNITWAIPLVIVLLFNLLTIKRLFSLTSITTDSKISIFIILFLSLINQFGLLLVSFAIFLITKLIELKNLRLKKIRIAYYASALNFIFWFIYSFFTTSWYNYHSHLGTGTIRSLIKKILFLLFDYPNTYSEIQIFNSVVPVLTLFFLLSLVALTLYTIKTDYHKSFGLRFILVVLLFSLISASIIATNLSETRYTFFLYPLILLVVLLTFNFISDSIFKKKPINKISFAVIASVFFIISGDFSLNHLINIDQKEYNFRMIYDKNKVKHYYPRWDVRTPAEIVNNNSNKDDIIIVNELRGEISPAIEHYLNRLDYIYTRYDHWYFFIISVNEGKNERWTNAGLIYDFPKLKEIINNASNKIWLITSGELLAKDKNFEENFSQYFYGTSIDNRINVYKIPPGSADI
jgi:hypothetical protein